MASRLQELLIQRAIIQEHLRWLDREIKACEGAFPEESAPAKEIPLTSREKNDPAQVTALEEPGLVDPADTLLAEYQEDPNNLRAKVQRGCLLYFCLTLALVTGVILLIHFGYSRRH